MTVERRTFMGWIAAGLAGLAGAVWWFGRKPPAGHEPQKPPDAPVAGMPDVFPKAYLKRLEMLVHRLVPDDDVLPGAATLGAFGYILKALADPEVKSIRLMVQRGAAQLDRVAISRFQTAFDRLNEEQQYEVIAAMVAGEGEVEGLFQPEPFIRSMVALTLEGCYGDPCHGANKDQLGWKSIGYAMHPPHCGH